MVWLSCYFSGDYRRINRYLITLKKKSSDDCKANLKLIFSLMSFSSHPKTPQVIINVWLQREHQICHTLLMYIWSRLIKHCPVRTVQYCTLEEKNIGRNCEIHLTLWGKHCLPYSLLSNIYLYLITPRLNHTDTISMAKITDSRSSRQSIWCKSVRSASPTLWT